ncbi:small nuclear ribonucleoprotein G-like [Convolutriloba macropyga]|uniref:small nuclear ribonucleoprotein G-like n=1 Tax=Convolutriloba macropyga TaxID=536237 RepID=UPI003F521710
MSKAHPPEMKKYMDKRLNVQLNGGRKVQGILRGFDPFMNIVMDESIEERKTGERFDIGMVVVRGNSIIMLEALEPVN